MRRLLLTAAGTFVALAATLTIPATPAAAIDGQQNFRGSSGVTIHRGSGKLRPNFRGDRYDRRGHRNLGGDVYFGEREYQGDTAWGAEGFNDWWHERPWRSHPRWVSTNSNCERQYWTGSGWRC